MNFLNRLDNGTIIAILVVLIPSLIAIGFYFGTEKINKENIYLSAENERLTSTFDSLNFIINLQEKNIDTLQIEKNSVKNDLQNAKFQIATYQDNHQTIEIKYSEPYSLFGGLVLINAEKYYDEVRFSFEGDIIASIKPEMDYKQTEITIKQGKRFFIRDHTSQIWIINILKIDSFEVKLELVKKMIP